ELGSPWVHRKTKTGPPAIYIFNWKETRKPRRFPRAAPGGGANPRSPPAPTKAALARTPPPSQPNLRGPRNVPLAPADVAERRSPPAPTKVVSAPKCPSPQVNLRTALLPPPHPSLPPSPPPPPPLS